MSELNARHLADLNEQADLLLPKLARIEASLRRIANLAVLMPRAGDFEGLDERTKAIADRLAEMLPTLKEIAPYADPREV